MLVNFDMSELYILRALLLDQQAVNNARISQHILEALVVRLHDAILKEDPALLEYPVKSPDFEC